jgi:flagellar biosynthesis regulator FlaF
VTIWNDNAEAFSSDTATWVRQWTNRILADLEADLVALRADGRASALSIGLLLDDAANKITTLESRIPA